MLNGILTLKVTASSTIPAMIFICDCRNHTQIKRLHKFENFSITIQTLPKP